MSRFSARHWVMGLAAVLLLSGTASAADVSIEIIRACACGLLTTAP